MPHPSLADLLEVLMWGLGLLVGLFYVIQEYKGKAPESLKENPRVRNLTYVVGGGAIGTLVDWQLLSKSNTEISKLELALNFAIAAAVTIIVGFIVLSVIVAVQAHLRNKRVLPAARVEATEAVLLFLSRGYSAYLERCAAADAKAATPRTATGGFPQMIKPIVLAMAAERTYFAKRENLRNYVSKILEMIPPYIAAQLGEQAEISTANYMRAVKIGKASPDEISRIHFGEASSANCDYILVLEQYPQDEYGTDPAVKFAIAVHKDEENCLPGAPLAFRQKRWQAMVTSRPQFPSGVSKTVQKQTAKYFRRMDFKSFLCVPMVRGGEVVGIVNIESKTEVFDSRDERIAQVAETLQPFSTTLASMIG